MNMNASSWGKTAIAKVSKRPCRPQNVLVAFSRQHTYSQPVTQRNYSSAVIAAPDSTAAPPPHLNKIPKLRLKTHAIHAGIILSRPPLLTPDLHPFEKAFFFYQKRLNERLAVPFTRYFYYKKDTPQDADWKIKFKERGSVPAKELGPYNAYGKTAWNDELLVKDKHMTEPQYIIDQLVKDARVGITEDGVVVEDPAARAEGVDRPRERITEADVANNFQRLDRKLDRTLYLVVRKKEKAAWNFPSGELSPRESLYQASERILVQSCGLNMNTWIIGRIPIAHKITQPKMDEDNKNEVLSKGIATFFMKGRIMAGQADLVDNKFDLQEYRWLTKEELKHLLSPDLFYRVCDSLHER